MVPWQFVATFSGSLQGLGFWLLAQGLGILTAACRFEGSVEGLRVSIGALVSFSPSSLNLSLSTDLAWYCRV